MNIATNKYIKNATFPFVISMAIFAIMFVAVPFNKVEACGGSYDYNYGGYGDYSGCGGSNNYSYYSSASNYNQPYQYQSYPQITYVPNQTNNNGIGQPYQFQYYPQIVYVPNNTSNNGISTTMDTFGKQTPVYNTTYGNSNSGNVGVYGGIGQTTATAAGTAAISLYYQASTGYPAYVNNGYGNNGNNSGYGYQNQNYYSNSNSYYQYGNGQFIRTN
ncbi:MAG: hypothetical protein WCQ00_02825 [bacterium]